MSTQSISRTSSATGNTFSEAVAHPFIITATLGNDRPFNEDIRIGLKLSPADEVYGAELPSSLKPGTRLVVIEASNEELLEYYPEGSDAGPFYKAVLHPDHPDYNTAFDFIKTVFNIFG